MSRLELRGFGFICAQPAGQPATLTHTRRAARAARLPVEHRTAQGAALVLMRATIGLLSSAKPDAWTPGDDVVGTGEVIAHCPPTMALIT